MKLISWNVSHPSTKDGITKAVRLLSSNEADIVALQEVPVKQGPLDYLMDNLGAIGLIPLAPLLPEKGWGLLVAGRYSMKVMEGLPGEYLKVPMEERTYDRNPPYSPGERIRSRILSVRVKGEGTSFELHTVHVPYGSGRGWRKIDTLRALAARLEKCAALPRIVCGDFNEPWSEHADGGVETWAGHNIFSKVAQDRWDEAVKKIFVESSSFGLTDVVRRVHGSDSGSMTSYYPRGSGRPRRYDHVFASREIDVRSAGYLRKTKWEQVSDHVPVVIDFGFA